MSELKKHREALSGVSLPKIDYQGKLIIGTPFYLMNAWVPYMNSLFSTMEILKLLDIDFEYISISGDSYVDRAKNQLCNALLEDSKATDLLIIDSDMEWTPDSVIKLLLCKAPLAGCDYPMKNNWESYCSRIINQENRTPALDEDGNIKCMAIPGGFMRIKKGTLQRMAKASPDNNYYDASTGRLKKINNFFEFKVDGDVRYGEDYCFCRKWNDIAKDEEPVIVPNCTMGHYGVKKYEGNIHEYLMRQPGGSKHKPNKDDEFNNVMIKLKGIYDEKRIPVNAL